jgi:hypothetical protein
MINDLFHVIDLSGQLLNKKEPADDDTTPFDEFCKYAQQAVVSNKDGEKIKQFVPAQDVPNIIYSVFVGQPDAVRIDAAMLIKKYALSKGKNRDFLIRHILD